MEVEGLLRQRGEKNPFFKAEQGEGQSDGGGGGGLGRYSATYQQI